MIARDIPKPAGQSGVTALEGPPWMRTTMGYFLPDSTFTGFKSQPCMFKPSFVHSRLSAFPQVADNAELLFVSWRHSPIGPAQISGGVSNELRSAAANLPSLETAKPGKIPKPSNASAHLQILQTEVLA